MALDVVGTLLCIAGWTLVGTIITNHYWKVSTVAGSVITTNTIYENLWHACATDSMGVSNCRDFDSMLNLPGHVQACRALVITAIVLGFFGTLLAFLGMRCTNIVSSDPAVKGRIVFSAGIIYILEGLSSIIAVSWYAAQVVAEFFDPFYAGTKYELGPALYMGWAGSGLAILGGGLLCCVCCTGARSSTQRDHTFKYAAARAATPISTAAPRTILDMEGQTYARQGYV
ncbi:claudin-15-like [Lampetra fluviatilis]